MQLHFNLPEEAEWIGSDCISRCVYLLLVDRESGAGAPQSKRVRAPFYSFRPMRKFRQRAL
jgi:hypothetical protein